MSRPRALILAAHEPSADPRIGWWASSLALEMDVVTLGASNVLCAPTSPTRYLDRLWSLRSYLSPDFLFYQKHFVNVTARLLEDAREHPSFDLILANDLFTLPAALTLQDESGARIVYDAHEFWPQSHHQPFKAETNSWLSFERSLAPLADLRVTVSPPLAAAMAAEYGCPYLVAPNAASLLFDKVGMRFDFESCITRRSGKTFLYQGAFAKGRGLDDLISNWPHNAASLALRGPDNTYRRELLDRAGRNAGRMIAERIYFLDAADVGDLVREAVPNDVGLIPYDPRILNNRLACPNKFSQYLAAGLPILTSRLDYVAEIVEANELGRVVDFSDRAALAEAVDWFIADRERLAAMSRRARAFFLERFNWEYTSRDVMQKIRELVA